MNLASRIEGANRFYGTELLVSAETREGAGEAFVFREIDRARVAGRAAPVQLFEPLGETGAVGNERLVLCERYEAALTAYRARDFGRAEALLGDLFAEAPADGPGRALLARVRAMRAAPPPPSWDGIFELPSK